MEYPKTENLYASNGAQDSTRTSGPEFGFRQQAVGQIATWLVTEKVDGMNMRVVFEPAAAEPVKIFGRTDRAQIAGDLMAHMRERFTELALFDAFTDEDGLGPAKVVLFGEGFGPGIQGAAGAAYGGSKRFSLFDVNIDGHWLSFDKVENIAAALGVPTVPVLATGVDLGYAKTLVGESKLLDPMSPQIEGIVVRTDPYLFDGRGNRVMFKYKIRDL